MEELKAALKGTAFEGQTLVGKELYIEAEVFDWFWLQKDTGSRMAVIYSNEVILEPMGDPIRTFKPEIPFTIYVSDNTFYYIFITIGIQNKLISICILVGTCLNK